MTSVVILAAIGVIPVLAASAFLLIARWYDLTTHAIGDGE